MKNGKIIQIEDRIPKLKKQKHKKINRRLVLYTSILFLLVLFVIYFRSPFSNIAEVLVRGNHYMSKQEVIEISGITNQISYFRVIPRQAEEKLAKRKEIKKAVVKKIFPHKIVVTIEEYKTTGYLQKDKKLYPLLENGTMLTALSGSTVPVAAPLLLGFDEEEIIQELSSELIKVSPGIFRSISEIHFNPLPADPLHLVLYMNEGYEVGVTVRNFAEKMEAYPLIIKQLKPEDKVVIHLELGAYIEYLNMGENRNEN